MGLPVSMHFDTSSKWLSAVPLQGLEVGMPKSHTPDTLPAPAMFIIDSTDSGQVN